MKKDRKELVIAKVLAGAAWADGEISEEERGLLDRVAAEFALSADETAELKKILDHPLGISETESLACDFLDSASVEERSDLFRRLEALFLADGTLGAAEQGILTSLRAWEDETPEAPSLLGRMRSLVAAARPGALRASPTFQRISSRLGAARVPETLDSKRREYATLFGAILYRVAFADGRVENAELEQLRSLLTSGPGVGPEDANQIISVIASRVAEEMDRQRLCASFNRVATMEERLRLLGCLFAVAKADGSIGEDEMREIRLIANYLWIDARSFHNLRVREA